MKEKSASLASWREVKEKGAPLASWREEGALLA